MRTQNPPKKFQWYLPTINGDIRLTREGPKMTRLHAFELTAMETQAMEGLRQRALSTKWGKSQWCEEADFLPLTHATYRTHDGITLHLAATIEDVQDTLARALKPKRRLVTGVRFADGRIEEAFERETEDGSRITTTHEPLSEYWADLQPDLRPLPVDAVTVAAPTIGCPMPSFVEADIRASHVLEQFLTPEQVEDYRLYGHFVSVGHDTGHRYMVIHRERPQVLSKFEGRQLYDLDAGHSLCVHDWEVPPAEEMLALHLCLLLPGKEGYIRSLPHAYNTAIFTFTA